MVIGWLAVELASPQCFDLRARKLDRQPPMQSAEFAFDCVTARGLR
jgi:hypothetical protein